MMRRIKKEIVSHKFRRAALVAMSAAAVTLGATAGPAVAAPRSGGGCTPQEINDWAIAACISEAPGSILRPDYYINAKPASYPSACSINTYLADLTSNTQGLVDRVSCASAALGHHGPWDLGLNLRHHYRTYVIIYYYNTVPHATFRSPVAIPGG
jgi:hypothetical protein